MLVLNEKQISEVISILYFIYEYIYIYRVNHDDGIHFIFNFKEHMLHHYGTPWICMFVLKQPLHTNKMYLKAIFKQSLSGLNSEISFF